jgi:hypothetical protein
MRKSAFFSLAALLVLLTGCASMFSGSSDQITIHSNDPAAKIQVNGNNVGTGSVVYSLPRGQTALITASKPGCDARSISTGQAIAGPTWLNIFFWPGFIVDAATGDMHKANPTDYTITPDCDPPR